MFKPMLEKYQKKKMSNKPKQDVPKVDYIPGIIVIVFIILILLAA